MKFQQVLCIIAGLLPLVVIVSLDAVSDFVLFNNYISDLGVGQNAALFNASLAFAALLIVPFVMDVYKHYNYLIILFLAAALSLVGVGAFPASSELHKPIAALFFMLAFASVLVAGSRMKRKLSKGISIALGVLGFAGLAIFNPFIETLLVFAIGLWVAGVGLFSKRLYEKS